MSQDLLVQMGQLFSCSSQLLQWIIGKSLENVFMSGKMVKQSLEKNKTSFLEEILFNSALMFAVHHDYLCFCILKRSPLIMHLFDNLKFPKNNK